MYRLSTEKIIVVVFTLFYSTISFSQNFGNSYQEYGGHHHSNYFPHEHDSAVTVKPKLIKNNFLYYGFLSSLNQHISIEYDRQMSDDIMLCGQIGVINSGLSQSTSSTTIGGGYFEGSVKLFFNPDYTRDGRHGFYAVEGLYIKPQLAVSIFSTTSTSYYSPYVYPPSYSTNQNTYSGAAILLSIGGQWLIAHTLALDLYAGVGCSFSNAYSANLPNNYNYYDYLSAGSNFPLAFTGGINIGLPF